MALKPALMPSWTAWVIASNSGPLSFDAVKVATSVGSHSVMLAAWIWPHLSHFILFSLLGTADAATLVIRASEKDGIGVMLISARGPLVTWLTPSLVTAFTSSPRPTERPSQTRSSAIIRALSPSGPRATLKAAMRPCGVSVSCVA
jgi:hypothetical protein